MENVRPVISTVRRDSAAGWILLLDPIACHDGAEWTHQCMLRWRGSACRRVVHPWCRPPTSRQVAELSKRNSAAIPVCGRMVALLGVFTKETVVDVHQSPNWPHEVLLRCALFLHPPVYARSDNAKTVSQLIHLCGNCPKTPSVWCVG